MEEFQKVTVDEIEYYLVAGINGSYWYGVRVDDPDRIVRVVSV